MRKLSFVACLIFFAACLITGSMLAQDAKRALTIDDSFSIKRVGSPKISPDGKWVAYTVSTTDLKADKSETRIWMKPIAGGEALPMTMKGSSAGNPQWSPDSKYLTFTASRNESKSQVWALNMLGGEAKQITFVKQGISGYSWSPDGSKLLLSITDQDPDAAGEKKAKPKPWVIDRLQFKRDYVGYLNNLKMHLYTVVPGDTTLVQITSGDYNESSPVWSPDGKLIAFVSNRSENPDGNGNRDIWVVSATNTDKGKTLLQITDNPGSDSSPAWSPDGKQITYTTGIEPDLLWYATTHLAVISSSGGTPRLLTTELDRNVSSPEFSSDGKSIFFVVEESAENHFASIGTNGKNLKRVVDGGLSVRSFDIVAGNTALLVAKPDRPSEIYLNTRSGLSEFSDANDKFFAGIELSEMENIHFNSKDGTEIEGFMFKPLGYDPALKYPTILRIHGGPVSQYSFSFNFEAQLFAANGYMVIITNPRGSSGYGQAFSAALFQKWGVKDFEDVMAGVDYLIEKGYSDPEKLGVGGWSYGGILTNYVITQTERFKGAISGASEVLYRANYGHDHYQYQWEKELGLPWENVDLWEELSPFNKVANVTTPTLVMGGEHDWNVPIQNSEQLYQALKRLGITTQLVVYPGQHHGFSKPSFQKDRYERYLKWYAKHVKGIE